METSDEKPNDMPLEEAISFAEACLTIGIESLEEAETAIEDLLQGIENKAALGAIRQEWIIATADHLAKFKAPSPRTRSLIRAIPSLKLPTK